MAGTVVAVDLGGTTIEAAAVGTGNDFLGRSRADTPVVDGPDIVLDKVAAMIRELVRAHGRVDAVGVGTAGVVDPARGTILSSTEAIRGWAGTEVKAGLQARLALPVIVDNDVHTHLLGELDADRQCDQPREHPPGWARPHRSVLLVAVGTGIGGSLAIDGRIHRGARFVAGHLGHVPAAGAEQRPCPCGAVGHVEAVASGPALVADYRRRTGRDAHDLRDVCAQAAAGDAAAASVLTDGGMHIGRLIGGLVNVLDPDVVVLTGGVSEAGAAWWSAVREAAGAELLPPIRSQITLDTLIRRPSVPAAALIGAARLARDGIR